MGDFSISNKDSEDWAQDHAVWEMTLHMGRGGKGVEKFVVGLQHSLKMFLFFFFFFQQILFRFSEILKVLKHF